MKPIKFNPNDPKLWRDYDPTERATEYVGNRSETSILISRNNFKTWSNPDVKNKRSKGIKKAHLETGRSIPKNLIDKIYLDSWSEDRRSGYVDKAKNMLAQHGYKISRHKIQHIICNSHNTVDETTHIANQNNWDDQFVKQCWEVWSPGKELLEIYDRYSCYDVVPPSIIYKIRFEMADSEPKEIRDFLLPYTGGKYLTNSKGKIENGRYIAYRKSIFPFLVDKQSTVLRFDDLGSLNQWINKKLGESVSRMYLHQIINKNNGLKLKGPLMGYYFKRKNNTTVS